MKTSEQWQKEKPEVVVLDPDGWDRENFQHSWYEELITEAEYERRLSESTCSFNRLPEVKEKPCDCDCCDIWGNHDMLDDPDFDPNDI